MKALALFLTALLLAATNPVPDGHHDFDFEAGTWTISGGPCCYRHIVRTLSDGASLAQLQAQNPSPHVAGLMMRLYDGTTGQWKIYWSKTDSGTFDAPLTGTFADGRGVFDDGATRIVYSDITANSFRTEQSQSTDGGKTWTATRTQTFTRVADADGTATGAHDFDFLVGSWQTHIAYLNGSTWAHMTGTVVNRDLWHGYGDMEDIRTPAFQGLTLRLYDTASHQWNLYWADSSDGALGTPVQGTFTGTTGDFYGQDTSSGRAVLVHQRYTSVPPNGYRFEQWLSSDGGHTWKANFIANLTRISHDTIERPASPVPSVAQQHGFDWQFGQWNIHMSRHLHPFSGSNERVEMTGTVNDYKLWNGRGNYAVIDAAGGASSVHILALRLYQPQNKQWTLSFTHKGLGALGDPMYGTFEHGSGTFYDEESLDGKAILNRFRFYGATAHAALDDEAFSDDGGKTWENEWHNSHTRETP